MRQYNIKHGFLSTYNATVFAKFTDDGKLMITMPVFAHGDKPSVKQAFLYWGHCIQKDAYIKVSVVEK